MKTTNTVKESGIVIIALVPIAYCAYIWNTLPAIIPIHFDSMGNPNNYAPRATLGTIVLLLTIGIYFLSFFTSRTKKTRATVPANTILKVRLLFALFTAMMSFNIIASARTGHALMSYIYLSVSFFTACFGNYMSSIRPNSFIGIRTPWVFKSDMNWRKTHQFAGKLWFFSGITFSFVFMVTPQNYESAVFTTFIIVLVAPTYLYSYKIHKQFNDSDDPSVAKRYKETDGDQVQYKNSDPWVGPFYFDKSDKRIMVPKKMAGLGWTLNFGNPYSYVLLIVLIGAIVASRYL